MSGVDDNLEECQYVYAMCGDEFQGYVFKNGGDVPEGVAVGVEAYNPRTKLWELHLFEDIVFGS